MANNHTQSSSVLKLTPEQFDQANKIIDRVTKEIEESDDGCVQCDVNFDGSNAWFSGDDNCNVDHVEQFARALIEELELDEPFYCSWAYTCDKLRVDEFGGGAMVIQRGKDTYWVDAMSHVRNHVERDV